MAQYLIQVAYTQQAWSSMLKNPQDRTKVLKPVLDKLGGSFGSVFFAFGEYDIVGILNMPANSDAATARSHAAEAHAAGTIAGVGAAIARAEAAAVVPAALGAGARVIAISVGDVAGAALALRARDRNARE